MDEQAGQATERTPDFIPGWFRRRVAEDAPPQIREAVRVMDASNFPVAFLVDSERVRPSGHGVSVEFSTRSFSLAVPPGYWIVRDEGGALHNWRDDEFAEQWVRENRLWLPPCDRPQVGEKGEDADAPKGAVEGVPGDTGWRGTPPAEGTRRHLILGAIREGDVLSDVEALEIADCVEAALIDATIAAEEGTITHTAFVAGGPQHRSELRDNPYLPPEFKQRIVGEIPEVDEPDRPDAEIRDSEGNLLGGLEVVVGAADGVPYVSLSDLESVFANLYEDITERQAKKQRQVAQAETAKEIRLSGTMQAHDGRSTLRYDDEEEKKIATKRVVEAALAAEQRVDAEDDRPLWRVELDYGLNHVRNAVAAWMGL